jgi:hypothetical protein
MAQRALMIGRWRESPTVSARRRRAGNDRLTGHRRSGRSRTRRCPLAPSHVKDRKARWNRQRDPRRSGTDRQRSAESRGDYRHRRNDGGHRRHHRGDRRHHCRNGRDDSRNRGNNDRNRGCTQWQRPRQHHGNTGHVGDGSAQRHSRGGGCRNRAGRIQDAVVTARLERGCDRIRTQSRCGSAQPGDDKELHGEPSGGS